MFVLEGKYSGTKIASDAPHIIGGSSAKAALTCIVATPLFHFVGTVVLGIAKRN
tara:strand:- start:938 stop:1099 length:162 start_codon:yes stop_codon:yes gene_type:complete